MFKRGSMPKYNGDSPIRDDGFYDYAFKGWNHEIESVESDQEYIADYESSGDLYSSVTFLYIDITNDDLTFDFTSITPLEGKKSYVDWGDESPIDNELSHTYSEPGEYIISVSYVEKIKCTGEESLNIIKLGDEVDEIEKEAFKNCSNLKTVDMPESIKHIGKDAFSECTSLNYFDDGQGKYLGNGSNQFLALISTKNTSIEDIDISPECKVIAQYAFSDCKNLKRIIIHDGVTCIDDGTFLNCNSLITIDMPETYSITEFGDEAFKGCSSLFNCDFSNLNLKHIGNNCFFDCTLLTLIRLPDSLISIGDSAFDSCHISYIGLPNNLESIGNLAFSSNIFISIIIPSSVQHMGYGAFYRSNELKYIYCEAKEKPEGWVNGWEANCDADVIWGHTPSK